MNEHKTKKTQIIFQQRAPLSAQQRRVSFSKPWTQSRQLDRSCSIIHRAKDKSNPVPRTVSLSRPILTKPSLKTEKSSLNASKGVCTRNRHKDATSSTTVDSRRRAQADPTPAHLKYGMFRKFSKVRRQLNEINSAAPARASEKANDVKPIVIARERSSIFKTRQEELAKERFAPLKRGPSTESQIPSPVPNTRHVHLSQTDPMHLDIKPKRFPSMLWC